MPRGCSCFFFFFNDTATTEIYTLSLHDALPIYLRHVQPAPGDQPFLRGQGPQVDRKSTRLNSSHLVISYAVFCLKKKRSWRASPATRRRSGMAARARRGCGAWPAAPPTRSCTGLAPRPRGRSLRLFFFLIIRGPRRSTPFPYRTLSR